MPSFQFDSLWPVTTPAVNTHYWFSESERGPRDPIIVWIQGGPGASSISGALTELGPFRLDPRSLRTSGFKKTGVPTVFPNKFAYTTIAGLLAVDYADVGYSFCQDKGCVWDDAKATGALLGFLNQFFGTLFPEHAGRELWIAGESYAGILISGLSYSIMKQGKLRLAGVLHGNGAVGHFCGCTEPGCSRKWPTGFCTSDVPDDAKHHISFFHRASLTSDAMYEEVQKACPDLNRPSDACSTAMRRMRASMGDFTRKEWWNVYKIHDTCPDIPPESLVPKHEDLDADWYCSGRLAAIKWMNLEAVREALHVDRSPRKWKFERDMVWTCSNDHMKTLETNFTHCPKGFVMDYRPHLKQLVDAGFSVLVYSGDVDAQIPHTASQAWTSGLGLKVKAPWQPYLADARIGRTHARLVLGYVVEYEKHFTFATILGAGHMVPKDRPAAIVTALDRYIHSRDLTRSQMRSPSLWAEVDSAVPVGESEDEDLDDEGESENEASDDSDENHDR